MNYEKFKLVPRNEYFRYQFINEGKNGSFLCEIRFEEMGITNYYNLSFGILDPLTDNLDDEIIINNGNVETVLNTVATAVLYYTHNQPQSIIFLRGRDNLRTRLYRMAISINLDFINEHFHLRGLDKDEMFIEFKPNGQFIAFIVTRKK